MKMRFRTGAIAAGLATVLGYATVAFSGKPPPPPPPPYNPQIAYALGGPGNTTSFMVANADGTDAVSLYSTRNVWTAMRLAPTGNRMVFVEGYAIKVLTYAVSSQGVTPTGVSTLSTETYRPWGVDVSPDGTELLFVEDTATPNQRAVFVMSMSGGPTTQLLVPPGTGNYSAVWAHSNSRIAILGNPYGQSSGLVQTIEIADLDPTNNYNVLNTNTIFTSTGSNLYQVGRIESAHTSDTLLFSATSASSLNVYLLDIGTMVVSPPVVGGGNASFSANDSAILHIAPVGAPYFYVYSLATGVDALINSSRGIADPDFLP